jgi:serine phosphatase RsbU (regulator of sigma subunit)
MWAMSLLHNQPRLSYGDQDGEHSLTLERDSTGIGRSPDQDLVLHEPFVSRRHALIQRLDGHYELVDQKSSHGTFVNGARVERARLHHGDTVQFGSLSSAKFQFLLDTGTGSTATHSLAEELLSAVSVLAPGLKDTRQTGREMEKLNFLLNAARQLNAGGAITDIFKALLQLSIQLTGVERGFVFLREGGEMRLALGLRSDGTIVAEDSTVSRRAMQKAIASERKFSVSDTLADNDASAWASVMANSIRCIYCIPLRKQVSPTEPNRLLGLLYLDSQIGAGSLSEIDHQVLDTVAIEAATLLHNALLADLESKSRLAAEELAVAAAIHSSLMSITLPTVSYAALQARSIPCLAIGGDFYDAVALDDCVYVAIADVSGKGVPASIVAATLQGIIHALMLTGQGLPEIAALVNRFLCTRRVGKYATMVLLKLYPDGQAEYINCGHIPPLLVTGSGTRRLTESNLIVGLIADASYEASRCKLSPGERILLVTDGITEVENGAGEQFGDAELDRVIQSTSLGAMLDCVAKFQATNEAQDDWTLVDIRYEGDAI